MFSRKRPGGALFLLAALTTFLALGVRRPEEFD